MVGAVNFPLVCKYLAAVPTGFYFFLSLVLRICHLLLFFLFLESPSIWSTFQPKLVKVNSLHGVLYCTHGLEIGQKDFCNLGVLNLSFSNSLEMYYNTIGRADKHIPTNS